MNLLIKLTPNEEAELTAAASKTGLAPEEFAQKLLREHLPSSGPLDELSRKLRERQDQDQVGLMPSRSTAELFAEWDKDAENLTDEEREAEDHFWNDFQIGINETRAANGMRQL